MTSNKNNFGNLRERSINDLIVFAVFQIEERGEAATFERLVKECFDSFPKVFSFAKYAKWPDARKIDRPLRDLRSRGVVSGDPSTSFSLTSEGKKQAEAIVKGLRQKKLL